VVASYYYDAFGNITDETGGTTASGNSYRYSGYQYDKESGLYYLNARYYSAKIARFMSQDTFTGNPGDPLSLNLYTYVSNNPLRYFDPTGHGSVPVTLPNGTKTTGNVVNGKTYLSNGSRVPEGSVVSTAGGDYMMKNGSGVKVDSVPVTTSSGSKTTGYVASGQTYYAGGSRVENGAVVTTRSGTYMMQNGKGVEVTPVNSYSSHCRRDDRVSQ
jgi:RHS repeat-associated protein